MVISFVWGQKDYRIPYAWKKLCAYILIVVLLFFIHEAIVYFSKSTIVNLGTATLLLLIYLWLIMTIERKEMQRIPLLKKLLPVNSKEKIEAEY